MGSGIHGTTRTPDSELKDAFAGRSDREVELPVSPFDGLVIARVLAILALALLAYSFNDGPETNQLVFAIIGVAALQPLLPVFWKYQGSYRQAQMVTDIGAFAVFVLIAPDYYWLCSIVVAGIIGNHAVLASLRSYVAVSFFALGVMAATGAVTGVEQYERGVGVILILSVGLGYLGVKTRASMRSARADLLHALAAARGLAHLTDLSGGVVNVVGDTEAVVGWPLEQWCSMDHRDIIHPDDLDGFWIDLDTAVDGSLIDRTARIRTSDDRWIWLRDISRVVMHRNRPYARGFSTDVSAQQDGLDRMSTEASTDVLTGLRNRRALLVELEARRHRPGHHLVLIDLNRFKEVNDTLGHDAGDVLLGIVARRLATCLRPDDVLARLGGDEFAIIMDDMRDTAAVAALVDRLSFEVSLPAEIGGVTITTSFSAGIVAARDGEADDLTMLRRADIAMYVAKRAQLTLAVFDDELERTAQRRAVLSRSLPTALDTNALTLHYQPIVDTLTGAIVSIEGLARWGHADYGLLSPEAFLEVVLLSDRSAEFTRRMVSDAIETVLQLTAIGSDVTVSVNLPTRTLEDVEFGHWFAAACASASVPPSRLVFEITERDIHDTTSITAAIDRLSALGVVIAIDDFGTGHATFERLRWRNVAQLKLDSDIVRNAASVPREREVLRSILELARRLEYDVVAEGVETEGQLELLRELGCPRAQGYLFAAAMTREDLLVRLSCVKGGPVEADTVLARTD
jgi:diguanylate cyclase (GGDEF)-like protein